MRKPVMLLFGILLALLLVPATAFAADASDNGGLTFRVGGTTTIGPTQQVDSVIVIDGDVVLQGVAKSTLWVVNGNATVNGRVGGEVMVVNGRLVLGPNATVNNVSLVRSTLLRDPRATIDGTVTSRSAWVSFGGGHNLFSFAAWWATTLPLLAVGLLFAALAGAQLGKAGALLTERPGASVLAAMVLWMGLPLVAIVAAITIIGIPLAIAAAIAIPVFWVLGYIVAAGRIGTLLVRAARPADPPARPYLAVVVGVVVVQLIGLIPFVGGAFVALAGLVGAGSLAVLAHHARRDIVDRQRMVRQEPVAAA